MVGSSTSGTAPLYEGLQVDDWTIIQGPLRTLEAEACWLCVCHCGTTVKRTERSVVARRLPACSTCMGKPPKMPEDLGKWPVRDRELRRALQAAGF